MLRKDRILTADKPGFAGRRRRESSAYPLPPSKTREMLEDILEGLNALGPRLDGIERDIKQIKGVLGVVKVSSGTSKRVKKNR